MSLVENLKQLFGLGAPASAPTPAPQPTVAAPPAPAPVPVEESRPDPAPSGMPSTPRQREIIFRFVVEKLAAYSTETEGLPTGLKLWIRSADTAEDDRMNVALYATQPGHFRQELARHLADSYIQLAPDWKFEWEFAREELPKTCTYQHGKLGLEVVRPADEKPLQIRVRALTGQTAQASYVLDPTVQTEFRIGRGQMVQTASGRVRTNDIAFLDTEEPGFDPKQGQPNGAVSRQHATIRYDPARRRYSIVADAGGLPANGNKTKILHPDETVDRADLPGVGYVLAPGDQIELGGEAMLLIETI